MLVGVGRVAGDGQAYPIYVFFCSRASRECSRSKAKSTSLSSQSSSP
jgi:hypothetical protein